MAYYSRYANHEEIRSDPFKVDKFYAGSLALSNKLRIVGEIGLTAHSCTRAGRELPAGEGRRRPGGEGKTHTKITPNRSMDISLRHFIALHPYRMYRFLR